MGMAIATESRYWLPDDLDTLPEDGNRYECIDGVLLVTPSPNGPHQSVVIPLAYLLHGYLRGSGVGRVVSAPADVTFEKRHLVEPDLFVIGSTSPLQQRTAMEALLLVIEILSPSTARRDRIVKRALYQRAGIPEYWLVDTDARTIERWRPSDERPEILSETLRWDPPGAPAPLDIDLPALFEESLGPV